MLRYPDWPTVICSLGFVVGHMFAFALWLYGLIRTGLWFFYLLVFVAALGILLAVVNTVIYYNPPLVIHTLGHTLYSFLFYGYIYSLLGQFVLSLICLTAIVRWIHRAHTRLDRGEV
jgi:hypothetical protein